MERVVMTQGSDGFSVMDLIFNHAVNQPSHELLFALLKDVGLGGIHTSAVAMDFGIRFVLGVCAERQQEYYGVAAKFCQALASDFGVAKETISMKTCIAMQRQAMVYLMGSGAIQNEDDLHHHLQSLYPHDYESCKKDKDGRADLTCKPSFQNFKVILEDKLKGEHVFNRTLNEYREKYDEGVALDMVTNFIQDKKPASGKKRTLLELSTVFDHSTLEGLKKKKL